MDPNETLRELRELVGELDEALDNPGDLCQANVARVVELVEALDKWLVMGGFLPDDWTRR